MTQHTLPCVFLIAAAWLAVQPAVAGDLDASCPPAVGAAIEPQQQWLAVDGETLQRAVGRWAESAGWQLQWQVPHIDYAVLGGLHFSGTFNEAIESLAFAYAGAQRPLKFKFWEGNKVLVVTEK